MKKMQLWLAYAGDELTCTVSITAAGRGGHVMIELAGTLTPERLGVYDLIIAAVKNTPYETVQLDVCKLAFFSGHTVNDCAIEQLHKLVGFFAASGKALKVLTEDGCVKEGPKPGPAHRLAALR